MYKNSIGYIFSFTDNNDTVYYGFMAPAFIKLPIPNCQENLNHVNDLVLPLKTFWQTKLRHLL